MKGVWGTGPGQGLRHALYCQVRCDLGSTTHGAAQGLAWLGLETEQDLKASELHVTHRQVAQPSRSMCM